MRRSETNTSECRIDENCSTPWFAPKKLFDEPNTSGAREALHVEVDPKQPLRSGKLRFNGFQPLLILPLKRRRDSFTLVAAKNVIPIELFLVKEVVDEAATRAAKWFAGVAGTWATTVAAEIGT